jgi:hypothetical protein
MRAAPAKAMMRTELSLLFASNVPSKPPISHGIIAMNRAVTDVII